MVDSCEKIMPMLSAYMDGELSEAEAVEVEKHISACELCSLTLESYRAINSDTLTVQAPDGFTERVMAKVKAESKPKKRKIIPFRQATLAAAMVALVLLGASGSFDALLGRANKTAGTAVVVNNAAEEMETELKENAEHIMSFSATFDAAPAEAAMPETASATAMEAPAAEPAPVMEEAPAAPAPESRAALTEADEAAVLADSEFGAPLAPVSEEAVEESVEAESEIISAELAGMVTYVEPAEGGWYIKVENNGEETDVYLPVSVAGEREPAEGEEISLIAEQTFDGYEYHYVALEIE